MQPRSQDLFPRYDKPDLTRYPCLSKSEKKPRKRGWHLQFDSVKTVAISNMRCLE